MKHLFLFVGIMAVGLLCSCGGSKSQQPAGETNSEIESSISIETMTSDEAISIVPAGCTCFLSFTQTDYDANKYAYADDLGTVAVMKINGKIIEFIIERNNEKDVMSDCDVIKAKSAEYQLEVTKEPLEGDAGYEASFYKGVVKVTNNAGTSVEKIMVGICGC